MAAGRSIARCAQIVRLAVTRTGQRRTTVQGLCVAAGKLQSRRNSTILSNNIINNYRNFCAAAVTQLTTDPANLILNVDVRNLSSSSGSSLSEAGSDEDEEQNCPSHEKANDNDVISKVQKEMFRSSTSGEVFAVVYIGGSQFKVTNNDTIVINKIAADCGDKIRLEKVLLIGGENFSAVGQPLLQPDLVRVEATVVEKTKTAKVISFKKKRRKGYKRTKGHRQDITVLRVDSISINPLALASSLSFA